MRYLLVVGLPLFLAAADDSFESKVKPLLSRTCTPCHVAGGQMYDKLPFDKADVVRANKEGVLRRLKGDDKEIVKKWFEKAPSVPNR